MIRPYRGYAVTLRLRFSKLYRAVVSSLYRGPVGAGWGAQSRLPPPRAALPNSFNPESRLPGQTDRGPSRGLMLQPGSQPAAARWLGTPAVENIESQLLLKLTDNMCIHPLDGFENPSPDASRCFQYFYL